MPMYVLFEEATAPYLNPKIRFTLLHRVPVRFSYVLASWFVAIAIPFFGMRQLPICTWHT